MPPSRRPFFLLAALQPTVQIFVIVIFFFAARTISQDPVVFLQCNGTNYSSPSFYESTLFHLLSNITTLVSESPSLFFDGNASTGGSPSSKILALAQCRPDLNSSQCKDCLNGAFASAISDLSYGGCGRSVSAIVRFDGCVLRYSDKRFSNFPEIETIMSASTDQSWPDPNKFSDKVGNLMKQVSDNAAHADYRYSTGVTVFSEQPGQKIYGMAWCNRELSSGQCAQCLTMAMGRLLMEKLGSRAVAASCLLRHEIYGFFDWLLPPEVDDQPPPPGGQTSANITKSASEGKEEGNKTKLITLIAILEAVALALFCMFFITPLLRRMRDIKALPVRGFERWTGDSSKETLENFNTG
ncbi:Cysteine-rich repeat secretory protein 38 [Apostasia shenzhenica]|uniref:Cysteine-rich repeat secretory protein 38 n=1 Tax=Apostasia shenzhenica TaxID=1088818 RepID=A0A2H9ZSW8_9ASPA|nr:Cysteine-rich repeat secretory protein 38 [Apostasia shenzhenica]